ncbi:MAG TPA: hypothetical protein VH116_01070 [Gemmatimonadales bacterium]|nr:hypothetical protein [Gemmatimonadales bacterium]
MGKINWGGVVLGGLVAGVVLNVIDFLVYGVWLAQDLAAAMQALGKPPVGGSAIGLFVVLDFLYGVGLVWLYAAIRPRFGPGPKTAVLAGLALWVFIGLLQALSQAPMGFMPQRVMMIGVIVALINLPLAGAVGAYFYKEA